jgi:hypothetical protein
VKENPRPMNSETEISTSSGKKRNPAAVNRTSFMVPAMFMAIGPQRVTVSKMFMVMTKPMTPEIISIALRPYMPSAGFMNIYFKTSISPVLVVHKYKNGRPNAEK